MGWLWTSSPGSSTGEQQATCTGGNGATQDQKLALTEEQHQRIFGKPKPTTPPSSRRIREEQADAELDAFLKSFTESEASDSARVTNAATKDATERKNDHNRILPDGSLDISPEAVFPRTMSCRQQFDQAFYCQSLGGKFNDLYRYGHLKSCSEQWSAFWFCMRTRTLPDHDKQREISKYYAAREEQKKKEYGSSEDIWEIRKVAVPKAFWRDPDEDDDDTGGMKNPGITSAR